MPGIILRAAACLLCIFTLTACGGGGGGGGSKPAPSGTSPSSTAPTSTASSSVASLDSDGDGHPNTQDAFPNDAAEWLDSDKDGVGDNADTSPLGQAIPAWPNYQGDAKHSGWVDITLDTNKFKQRWSKAIQMTSTQQGVAGDGFVFFNNGGVLTAVSAHTGQTLWTRAVATSNDDLWSYQPPAYADGMVYIQTGGGGNGLLWAFNAADGRLVFQIPINVYSRNFMAPVVQDGMVYIAGDANLLYAINAKTGALEWSQMVNQSDQFTPAVAGNNVITYGGNYMPELSVFDRKSGNLQFDIADTGSLGYSWGISVAPVVSGDYVLTQYAGRIAAFSLSRRQLAWEVTDNFAGQPVVKGEDFYTLNRGVVEIRRLSTGALVSSIKPDSVGFVGQLLVTNNLLFVCDESNTYAYQLDTGTQVWDLAGKAGGMSMAEGALTIFAATGVVAIDLEGDIDADGLPDWWEKRFNKNLDPSADTDGDGLTALQEFNLATHPLQTDTDGDGLADGEETSGTNSPLIPDTDNDGLSDYAEVKTHRTDPVKADSDGDTLNDIDEIAAGLNPLDANDALADADGDGFSNLHEVRANTLIGDATSRPRATDWTGPQGNNRRSSYSPVLLDDSRFSERWTRQAYQNINSLMTAGNNLIVRAGANRLSAWDSATGTSNWMIEAVNNLVGASTDAGKVVYINTSVNYPSFTVAGAANGTNLATNTLGNYSQREDPLISGDKLFDVDSGSQVVRAYSLTTGSLLWTTTRAGYIGSQGSLVVDNRVIGFGSLALYLFSTTDGSLLKTINYSSNGIARVMAGTRDNVLVIDDYSRVASVSLADGAVLWENRECVAEKAAVGNGKVYILSSTNLCVVDELTGNLSWSLPLAPSWYRSNLVLTASHLFFSDSATTYGVNLAQKSVTWRLGKPARRLALGSDGTLYLQLDNSVTAIDTEGDGDADGMLQWWERRYGGDLDPTADADADGLTNVQEYNHKTNPLVADTDSDGLSDAEEINTAETDPLVADSDKDGVKDGAEVNTHDTDPLLADSDGDGIDDGRELALGMDASDEDDADEDSDSDGFSNRDEIYSGSRHTDAASLPLVSDWAMKQANAAHTGFQPYRINEVNFGLRWSKTFSLPARSLVTGQNRIFILQNNGYYTSGSSLLALNVVDGTQKWRQDLPQAYNLVPPAYSNGRVILHASNPPTIRRFDASSGVPAANISLGDAFYGYEQPSVLGNDVYSKSTNGVVATRLDTGATSWTKPIPASNYDIALNDQYLFYSYATRISAIARATGVEAFSIDLESSVGAHLVLGSRNNILTHADEVISYDIATRRVNWRVPGGYTNDDSLPVVANGQVLYTSANGELTSVNEVDGKTRWSWRPENQYLSSNIVATLSHIFVASTTTTYALSVATGELLWSYNAGGNLALGVDGALYIQSERQLVAINLEGDSDGDGMPDWWERHYGFDKDDASDAAQDLDGDGLTNLEEFNLGTYADNKDSDGDSLEDADEVNTHHTDPGSADSDGDGMRDDWEVDNGFDPMAASDRDQDTDGDTVPNYYEFLVGTDPNDALSLPQMFAAGVYSFEDAALPAGWVLGRDSNNVGISLNNASHGTKALQLLNKVDISFTGFFAASDLSLDVKSTCANTLGVYVDDQLAASIVAATQWTTLKTVIPLGAHTVSIRSNSNSCAIYLDNVVVAAAKTNTQLGVQFAGLYNDQLQFVDANKAIVRRLGIRSPDVNQSIQSIAAVDNEKMVVAFGGYESRLGVLDLATFNWRYFSGLQQLTNSYWGYNSSNLAARGNFAYVATYDAATNAGSISRVDLTSGAITRFGTHFYTSIALDSAGAIHAYSDGVVYKFDPVTLALVSEVKTITGPQILLDKDDRLIVVAYNEVVRYDAQRLIDKRLLSVQFPNSAVVNERNELIIANQSGQVQWYSSDWDEPQTWAMPTVYLVSFPQPDSDADGMPDWWEMANSLNIATAADAASDTDTDGLTALEEYNEGTNPQLDDTDGDLLNDGDEVNDFGTNPNKPDSDSDGLSDGEEVGYSIDPLQPDTDGDAITDFLEVTHFHTDPKDAASKPAPLVNFLESFENPIIGWVTPADADAGWSVVANLASNGTKSLRSGSIGNGQTAEVEWSAVFNVSTLTFDALVSSESCCDDLRVLVDGQEKLVVRNSEQWQFQSLAMSAGYHTIKFIYRKDGSSIGGSDAVWIDNIRVQ